LHRLEKLDEDDNEDGGNDDDNADIIRTWESITDCKRK
jgi:hypothetical protein